MLHHIIFKLPHVKEAVPSNLAQLIRVNAPIVDPDRLPKQFDRVIVFVEPFIRERDPSFVYLYAVGFYGASTVVVLAHYELRLAQNWDERVIDLFRKFKADWVVSTDDGAALALKLLSKNFGNPLPIMTAEEFLHGRWVNFPEGKRDEPMLEFYGATDQQILEREGGSGSHG